jgi:hypothetical protein
MPENFFWGTWNARMPFLLENVGSISWQDIFHWSIFKQFLYLFFRFYIYFIFLVTHVVHLILTNILLFVMYVWVLVFKVMATFSCLLIGDNRFWNEYERKTPACYTTISHNKFEFPILQLNTKHTEWLHSDFF